LNQFNDEQLDITDHEEDGEDQINILSIKSNINFNFFSSKTIFKFRRTICILLAKYLPNKDLNKFKRIFQKIDYSNTGYLTKIEIND